jgi:hypothetical protein
MRVRLRNICRIALATFASVLVAAPLVALAQGLGGVNYGAFGSDITVHGDDSIDVVESFSGRL